MAGKGVRRAPTAATGPPEPKVNPVPGPELSRYRRKPAAARSLHVGSPGQKQEKLTSAVRYRRPECV